MSDATTRRSALLLLDADTLARAARVVTADVIRLAVRYHSTSEQEARVYAAISQYDDVDPIEMTEDELLMLETWNTDYHDLLRRSAQLGIELREACELVAPPGDEWSCEGEADGTAIRVAYNRPLAMFSVTLI